jgi:8-oxo-dGTP diphosphatase
MPIHPSEQDIKVAVDAVIFTVEGGALQWLQIQMKKAPFEGRWAFPGGLIQDGETTEGAMRRILREQTGMDGSYLEQLAVFDAVDRDPFGRVVSVAYFALVPAAGVVLKTTDKYADVRWQSASAPARLAYDHGVIGQVALKRLRARLLNSNVAWGVLPQRFSLTQMQAVYEAMLGQRLDKRNFRKKILSLGLVKAVGGKAVGQHRPAQLYSFKRAA